MVCEFLLHRGLEHENCISTLKAFSDIRKVKGFGGNPYDYSLAHLTLIYSPKDGVVLLRRALRSSTPGSAQSASVLMAAIDTNWSNNELIKVLKEDDFNENRTNKKYLIAALLHSSTPEFQEFGRTTILETKTHQKNKPGWTWNEVTEANMEVFFRYSMKQTMKDLNLLDLEKIESII